MEIKIKSWFVLLLVFLTSTTFGQKINLDATTTPDSIVVPESDNIGTSDKTASLLWEISGNGLQQPSYLFGTIHIIPKSDYFWTDIMEEKFNTTEMLVLEIDMENPMMLMISMMGSMRMKDGVTLHDLLTDEEYKAVNKFFSKELGMSLATFDKIKPMFTSMMVAQGEQGAEETTAYEMELMEKAKQRNMKIEGLETAKYQMSMFDSIPYDVQAKMLVDAISEEGSGDSEAASLDEMIELYKAQDLQGLYNLITAEDSGIENYEDILLITRNKNWIPKISKMAAKKPTFFAVGAGHLPGEQGVINLLIAAGFTVRPVR